MRAILSDANTEGHVRRLVQLLAAEPRRELWEYLKLPLLTFADLGLEIDSSDVLIWETCQAEQAVLITANRNADGPDSLDVALRERNAPDNLPIFTLADANRLLRDRYYAERVADQLLEYLYDIHRLLGAGRMYLP